MELTSTHENTTNVEYSTNTGVDWTAMVRLAAVTSVIAAMVAALTYGLLPDTTIIVEPHTTAHTDPLGNIILAWTD